MRRKRDWSRCLHCTTDESINNRCEGYVTRTRRTWILSGPTMNVVRRANGVLSTENKKRKEGERMSVSYEGGERKEQLTKE